MNRLYEEAKKYPDQAYTFYRREPGDYVLLDGQENPFARVAILRKDYDDAYEVDDIDNVYEQDTCDLLLRFLEEVKQGKSYKPNEEGKIQTSYDGYTLQVRPCQKEEGEIDDPEQWVSTLEAFAYYLPVVKENDKNQSYCLEIKLPGFVVFGKEDDETPCGCGEGAKVVPPPCYVAWKKPLLLLLAAAKLSKPCYRSCDYSGTTKITVRSSTVTATNLGSPCTTDRGQNTWSRSSTFL